MLSRAGCAKFSHSYIDHSRRVYGCVAVCDNILASRQHREGAVLAHISRKELKKDEVRETFAHGAEALLSHQQLAMYVIIIALVGAIGFFGWKTYSERQTVRASAWGSTMP